ncbi:PKD domain-containing protein [Thermomonospora curvata]|uniref:PKD domain containing protein n=1 Tax=Thermomonospora curvata (strain ATCC 19995 / DSM 43183 / JCM 3096 / KCTC 9072 / NBRC 15933 / NCIMB 10081 / Henssen B9) TaxID=471852 RepID=D1A7L2_THECD|nr:PKD domain containing protein [Thermomonospora curvata DSM 43183]PKK15408.1 MAG: PKD domain containing protein [Thermomonospora sp. CIF 1]
MRLRKAVSVMAGLAMATGALVGVPTVAQASPATGEPHNRIVSDDPVDYTPQIQDGSVKSIVKIGDRIFIGGDFTQVKEPGGGKPMLTRNRLFSMNATTGEIDAGFNPNVGNGEVSVLLPASDGQSLYVGGTFTSVGGASTSRLVRINATTGQVISSFSVQTNGRVRDLRLANGRLYVAGDFTHVNGVSRPALAAVNPNTGALLNFLDLNISGTHRGLGVTLVYKMDITPDGSKLVIIGNFNSVAGQTRNQVAMIDLSGEQATLAPWSTTRYAELCSSSFHTYMRDVDFSPDGSFFVITTTGAYSGGPPKLCDTHARWETAGGADQQPTWVNWTGGDTSYAVEVTDAAVYVGGHFRWANNPFGSDKAGQGAVSREGIAALDPANGLPFSWNPGRTRGVGVFDLLATSEGLWMGSDTDEAGGEWHPKLAMFPLAGGTKVKPNHTGELPGNVYYAGGLGLAAQNFLRHRSFDGSTAGSTVNHSTGGFDWRTMRGAFMINGELFYGHSNGKFYRRSFDGETLGTTVTEINTADQLTNMSTWHNQVPNITGMFFANGRIYYTRGQSALYYRYFTPESNVVGAQELTAVGNMSGVNWSSVGGMFVHGDKLYFVNNSSSGRLYRMNFVNGVPSGTPQLVDSNDWRGRAVFLYSGVPNELPEASFTSQCDQLECSFDASASEDPDGTIASYSWDFGDGKTGTGKTVEHTYDEPGTYTVKLTVTDNRGGQGTVTEQVSVTQNATAIGYRGGAGFNANTREATVTVPSSVQPGDGMVLIMTANSTSVTITPPAGWTQIGTQTAGSAVSTVWKRVATAGDAGSTVSVGVSDYAKVDLRLLAYEGTDTGNPVAAISGRVDASTVTEHATPTVTVSSAGAWAISYWADKSSSTTEWTAPSGPTIRGTGVGSGGGRIMTLVGDTDGPVPTGSYGGLVATTDAASRGLMWTIILARQS